MKSFIKKYRSLEGILWSFQFLALRDKVKCLLIAISESRQDTITIVNVSPIDYSNVNIEAIGSNLPQLRSKGVITLWEVEDFPIFLSLIHIKFFFPAPWFFPQVLADDLEKVHRRTLEISSSHSSIKIISFFSAVWDSH